MTRIQSALLFLISIAMLIAQSGFAAKKPLEIA